VGNRIHQIIVRGRGSGRSRPREDPFRKQRADRLPPWYASGKFRGLIISDPDRERVTIARLCSISSATAPGSGRSRQRTLKKAASSMKKERDRSSRLRAITGSITFSSSTPTAAEGHRRSFRSPAPPPGCHLEDHRFTFPGMIEEPAATAEGISRSAPGPGREEPQSWRSSSGRRHALSARCETSGSCAPSPRTGSPPAERMPVERAISATVRAANSGWRSIRPTRAAERQLFEVANVARSRRIPCRPGRRSENSAQRHRTASCRCVRPIFRTSENSAAFPKRVPQRGERRRSRSDSSGASRSGSRRITSLLDWHRFTWSFGGPGRSPRRLPSSSFAVRQHLVHVHVRGVPEPVWKTSTTNCRRTSLEDLPGGAGDRLRRGPETPARLTPPRALSPARRRDTASHPLPADRKILHRRCDCAPNTLRRDADLAIESFSTRKSVIAPPIRPSGLRSLPPFFLLGGTASRSS